MRLRSPELADRYAYLVQGPGGQTRAGTERGAQKGGASAGSARLEDTLQGGGPRRAANSELPLIWDKGD